MKAILLAFKRFYWLLLTFGLAGVRVVGCTRGSRKGVGRARSGRGAPKQRRQFGQRPDLEVGAARKALAALAVAVAPDDAHAEVRRPMRVPGGGGLEGD